MFLKLRADSGIGEVSPGKTGYIHGKQMFFCVSRRAGGEGAHEKQQRSLRFLPHKRVNGIVGQAHSAGVAHSGFSSTKKGMESETETFCGSSSLRLPQHKEVNGIVG